MSTPVLLLFADGVGLAPLEPGTSPFAEVRAPALEALAGGPLGGEAGAGPLRRTPDGGLGGLDAALGVPGTPASGTGHAALISGIDAPSLHGGHFGPWVPVALREAVDRGSLFRLAGEAGHPVRFANATPAPFARRPPRFEPGITLAARRAGLLTRHGRALARGDAVAGTLDNELWRARMPEGLAVPSPLPRISPREAGRDLARMTARGGLTVFAHYDTDRVGHRGGMPGARTAVARLDRFVYGVLEALPPHVLLCVASDHGNLEDVRAGHTANPALLLARGPGGAELLEEARRISDVAPLLLEALRGRTTGGDGFRGSPVDGRGGLSRSGRGGRPGPTPRGSGAPPGRPGSATGDGRTRG